MRARYYLLIPALLLTVQAAQAGKVIVPGEKTESPTPNLGLVPAAPPATQAPASPLAVATPPLSQATATGSASNMDYINPEILKSLDLDGIKQNLPPDMKGMSQDQLNSFLKSTAQAKPSEAQQVQIVTGGGSVAPKTPTEFEKKLDQIAKRNGPAQKIDPSYQKVIDAAIAERKQFEKKYERDPLIIPDYSTSSFDAPFIDSSLQVGVAKEYTWGQKAFSTINRVLGFDENTLLSRCQLRLNIKVKTDDGKPLYKTTLYSNTANTVKYSGILKSIEVIPMAVCLKPDTLPRNGGIITAVGDKYGVSLMQAQCDVPPYDPQKKPLEAVLISYAGDEKLDCRYK